ncbi:cytochrome P450 [Nonomuraea monospora]|uniref:Cytochrome P450 n=1 Tax=Nonomuraea monospora TaxID=568818 RepID=A0ABN3CSR2_9ACTN
METSRPLAAVPFAPGHVPVLGNLPAFGRRPLAFLAGLRLAGDVVRIGLGTREFVYFSDPAAVHDVLVNQAESFANDAFLDRIGPLIQDEALLVLPYERHLPYRRRLNAQFRHARVPEMAARAAENARELAGGWPEGRPFRLDLALLRLSAANSCSALLGRRLPDAEEEAVARSAMTIGALLTARAMLPAWLSRLPLPANRRFVRACELLRSVARGHAAEDSLLRWLDATLHDPADGSAGAEQLTDERLTGDAATVLFGGIETVSSAMAWFFWELSQAPELAGQVWDEVASVTGGHQVSGGHRSGFRLLEAALWETLRLHPGIVFTRRAEREVTVGGVRLPAGTELLVSPYAMHRDPALFPRPDEFDPRRWLGRTASAGHAFLPFGAGHRKCLGDNQAMAQMTMSLAVIGSSWRVEVREPGQVSEVVAATTRPDRLEAVACRR